MDEHGVFGVSYSLISDVDNAHKYIEYDAFGFIPKPFGTEGPLLNLKYVKNTSSFSHDFW